MNEGGSLNSLSNWGGSPAAEKRLGSFEIFDQSSSSGAYDMFNHSPLLSSLAGLGIDFSLGGLGLSNNQSTPHADEINLSKNLDRQMPSLVLRQDLRDDASEPFSSASLGQLLSESYCHPPPSYSDEEHHLFQSDLLSNSTDAEEASSSPPSIEIQDTIPQGRNVSPSPYRSSNVSAVQCVYFNTPRGCRHGSTCKFAHIAAPDHHSNRGASVDPKKPRSTHNLAPLHRSYTHNSSDSRSTKPCMFFSTPSGCKHGNNCKFAHS